MKFKIKHKPKIRNTRASTVATVRVTVMKNEIYKIKRYIPHST